MTKKKTASKLRKELDKWFSLFVRISNADEYGICNCFTCGARKHWKEIQAGHFMSRKHMATRWHLENVMPQCVKCNMYSQGEQFKFAQALGMKKAKKMQELSMTTKKNTTYELEQAITHLKGKVKQLTNQC
tara:strand:- start:13155 stop:13547 length:393 start_codon:yes stop_codon:yes gene_type:complete